MSLKYALVAFTLAASPLVAQENGVAAPEQEPVATPTLAFDVDCTDEVSVLSEMESQELKQMVAIRAYCTDELVRLADSLGADASGESAFHTALSRLELEIATLKIFQADLLSGGRIDNALRRTETEIEALAREVQLQTERGSDDAVANGERLTEMRESYTRNRESMDQLKEQVDSELAELRDNAPDIAIKIRLDGLEAAIASQQVFVAATQTLMADMLSLQDSINEGQETN